MPILQILIVLSLAGALNAADAAPELPQPSGSFAVGRTTLRVVDASRLEPFTDDPADHRELLLHIWYPAATAAGEPATYVEGIGDEEMFRATYKFVGLDRLRAVHAHALANARLSSARKRYPVILFSHGLGMVSFLYSAILENLASHGYVVVGVEHPYFASTFQFPDGHVVKRASRRQFLGPDATAEQQAAMIRIREEEAIVQARDLIFVLDHLAALKWPERLDLARVGVFGHSRGGFAAPHACLLDSRFKACLNLDGYRLTEEVMTKGIRQPYMHIEELDTEPTEAERAEQRATFARMGPGGAYHVVVAGAKHMSFTDAPLIAPENYSNIGIDARRALQITNAYVLAFLDRFLRGRASALLSGRSAFPEVTFERVTPEHATSMAR
jgi:predicted dienelactone hydrolase